MRLHDLKPFPEERKNRRRIGRGSGSGWGKTSARGTKGQKSRSGASIPANFEGGQMPLARRLPKRGFKNFKFKVTYAPVNLDRLLEVFAEETTITLDSIYRVGLAPRKLPVKILANGEVSRAVTVEAHRFSSAAAEKIAQAGGSVLTVDLKAKVADEEASAEAPVEAPATDDAAGAEDTDA